MRSLQFLLEGTSPLPFQSMSQLSAYLYSGAVGLVVLSPKSRRQSQCREAFSTHAGVPANNGSHFPWHHIKAEPLYCPLLVHLPRVRSQAVTSADAWQQGLFSAKIDSHSRTCRPCFTLLWTHRNGLLSTLGKQHVVQAFMLDTSTIYQRKRPAPWLDHGVLWHRGAFLRRKANGQECIGWALREDAMHHNQ